MVQIDNIVLLFFVVLATLVKVGESSIAHQLKKFPCFQRNYQQKKFDCQRDFFLSFRRKPTLLCESQFKILKACRDNVDRECLKEATPKHPFYSIYNMVLKRVNEMNMEKTYCKHAGLMNSIPSEMGRKRLGCQIEYYSGKQYCMDKFSRKYRQNRGNPSLCLEYQEMRKCINKKMIQFCSKEAVRKLVKIDKKLLSKTRVDSNPFCEVPKSKFRRH